MGETKSRTWMRIKWLGIKLKRSLSFIVWISYIHICICIYEQSVATGFWFKLSPIFVQRHRNVCNMSSRLLFYFSRVNSYIKVPSIFYIQQKNYLLIFLNPPAIHNLLLFFFSPLITFYFYNIRYIIF